MSFTNVKEKIFYNYVNQFEHYLMFYFNKAFFIVSMIVLFKMSFFFYVASLLKTHDKIFYINFDNRNNLLPLNSKFKMYYK